jgi:hypothetical protein
MLVLLLACSLGANPDNGTYSGSGDLSSPDPSDGGLWIARGPDLLAGGEGLPIVPGPVGCGRTVSGPGDVTGDGVPDVVVACDAPGAHLLALVLDGSALLGGAARLTATLRYPLVLEAPTGVGDVDADGLADLGFAGRSQGTWGLILPGRQLRADLDIEDVAWHLEGEWYSGPAPRPAGDLDADGSGDVLVSGANGTFEGAAAVVSGAALSASSAGSRLTVAEVALRELPGVVPVGEPGSFRGRLFLAPVDDEVAEVPVTVWTPGEAFDRAPILSIPVALGFALDVADLGDLDADGAAEVVFASEATRGPDGPDLFGVVPGASIPSSGSLDVTPFSTGRPPGAIVPCDLDGDGIDELVTHRGIFTASDLLSGAEPSVAHSDGGVCVGDLDGDGADELAWADPGL